MSKVDSLHNLILLDTINLTFLILLHFTFVSTLVVNEVFGLAQVKMKTTKLNNTIPRYVSSKICPKKRDTKTLESRKCIYFKRIHER